MYNQNPSGLSSKGILKVWFNAYSANFVNAKTL